MLTNRRIVVASLNFSKWMRLASWASASFPSDGIVRIARIAMAHEHIVGHFLCGRLDRTFGGKYVCFTFFSSFCS
jgi:hypothetical protein